MNDPTPETRGVWRINGHVGDRQGANTMLPCKACGVSYHQASESGCPCSVDTDYIIQRTVDGVLGRLGPTIQLLHAYLERKS
jgi:hypothetical protein